MGKEIAKAELERRKRQSSTDLSRNFRVILWSWPVVGVVTSVLLGGGISVATSTIPKELVIALSLFVAGNALLICKLLAYGGPGVRLKVFLTALIAGSMFGEYEWVENKPRTPATVESNLSKQLQDPILEIDPRWEVKSTKPGSFSLSLRNAGPSDIRDKEIYRDCFTMTRTNPIAMERLGAYIVYPDVSLPKQLKSGDSEPFMIDISDLLPALEYRRRNWYKLGNAFLNVLRIKVNYKRNADRKSFVFMTEYIVSETFLTHLEDPRGLYRSTGPPGMPSGAAVKQWLESIEP